MRSNKAKIPHIRLLNHLVDNEDQLRQFLQEIELRTPTVTETEDGKSYESTAHILREICPEIRERDKKISTTLRRIGSLITFNFLKEKEGNITLTSFSKDFIEGKTEHSDLILECITDNLEWSYFTLDVLELAQASETRLAPPEILDGLEERTYDIEESQARSTSRIYLREALAMFALAGVIDYDGKTVGPGPRSAKEISKYASRLRRDSLKILQMLHRRVPPRQLRKDYQTTVEAYLGRTAGRNNAKKLQDKIKDMSRRTRFSGKAEAEKPFTSKWELVDDLYEWQVDFAKKWMDDGKGIAKVVTGAGKTHLAMAVMERLKREHDDFHATVIVPTIPLMHQWKDNLVRKLQVSPDEIGLRGGGRKDGFSGKRILVTVINSAIKNDFISKETEGIKDNLLVVDECHRSGAAKFRAIFGAQRRWELGLSATPEREADDYFKSVIQKQLGPILATYTYENALDDGIIPPYSITNYAVLLENDEKARYRKLTKDIENIIKRLKMKYRSINRGGGNFSAKIKTLQSKYPNDRDLFLYFQKTKERKMDLLYKAKNRSVITCTMLNTVLGRKTSHEVDLSLKEEDRVIVFHENIDEINDLFMSIDSPFVSIYHSQFPSSLNKIGLELYQRNATRVLLSVKALVEGIDVPSTNLGIIMASSSSRVQRVQSLGRILRKAEGKDETNLVIVYVHNTTDERIYQNTNWDALVGEGRVGFRQWSEFGELEIEDPGIKFQRREEEKDVEVNEDELVPGGLYPGRYDGGLLSFDSRGKLFVRKENSREYLDIETNGLWGLFRTNKPTGGSFKINKNGHVLIAIKDAEGWRRQFLGYAKDYNLVNYIPEAEAK